MRGKEIVRNVAIVLIALMLLLVCLRCSSDKKSKSQFTTRYELENALTVAFHSYGVIGASIEDDSNLMVVYARQDFLKTYRGNTEELNALFDTWLDHLYQFKGKKQVVGILVRHNRSDLFHASRDRDGKCRFRVMG
jgi:hypothetical protein